MLADICHHLQKEGGKRTRMKEKDHSKRELSMVICSTACCCCRQRVSDGQIAYLDLGAIYPCR